MDGKEDGKPELLEPTYTLQQVAAHFNVTDQTIRRWIKLQLITARRAGLRKFVFTKHDIEAAFRRTAK